uniref:Uncharacterized protein n=1 Tax=Lotharella globosa TaxID=91324 RepID=A0A6V3JDJ1_9EUKA|mmetsp:Transcript_16496/g.33422  ORF Transcript_16496/g.33422 Transcript_16496/m.33422 type:complete len:312 (-) Transcript_16496:290-1225(-)
MLGDQAPVKRDAIGVARVPTIVDVLMLEPSTEELCKVGIQMRAASIVLMAGPKDSTGGMSGRQQRQILLRLNAAMSACQTSAGNSKWLPDVPMKQRSLPTAQEQRGRISLEKCRKVVGFRMTMKDWIDPLKVDSWIREMPGVEGIYAHITAVDIGERMNTQSVRTPHQTPQEYNTQNKSKCDRTYAMHDNHARVQRNVTYGIGFPTIMLDAPMLGPCAHDQPNLGDRMRAVKIVVTGSPVLIDSMSGRQQRQKQPRPNGDPPATSTHPQVSPATSELKRKKVTLTREPDMSYLGADHLTIKISDPDPVDAP